MRLPERAGWPRPSDERHSKHKQNSSKVKPPCQAGLSPKKLRRLCWTHHNNSVFALNRSRSAAQEVENDRYGRQNQENVNEQTRDVKDKKSTQPQNYQHDPNNQEHIFSPIFPASRA